MTVERYNSFVDAGKDADFGKPAPKHKIQTTAILCGMGNPERARHAFRPEN